MQTVETREQLQSKAYEIQRHEIERLCFEEESLIEEQEKRVILRRIYHEAPNDIMELIVMIFSDLYENGIDMGGMDELRLVCCAGTHYKPSPWPSPLQK